MSSELTKLTLGRCARPTIGTRSTYTVLGFVGYGVGAAFASALTLAWSMTLQERLISLLAPPLAFLVVVAIATAIAGHEWIVFYQTAISAAVVVAITGAIAGGNVWRLLDVAVLGIGVFLVFGRLGCFAVACCHGRPASRGVVYGQAHVAAGFWPRWRGRTLFPIQLVESAASLALVIVGLAFSDQPGRAAVIYADGYALLRFGFEHLRGDPIRPFARGLSEAQWFSIAVMIAVAIARPSWWTLGPVIVTCIAALALVVRQRQRELFLPPHLRALDRACTELLANPNGRRDTSLGIGVSCRRLEDGRLDWVLSSTHPMWSLQAASRLAADLWRDPEVIEGRTPGLVHVIARE